jgi:hypothetical protein
VNIDLFLKANYFFLDFFTKKVYHYIHQSMIDSAQIAQLVEQGIENPCVAGSIPALGTIYFPDLVVE